MDRRCAVDSVHSAAQLLTQLGLKAPLISMRFSGFLNCGRLSLN